MLIRDFSALAYGNFSPPLLIMEGKMAIAAMTTLDVLFRVWDLVTPAESSRDPPGLTPMTSAEHPFRWREQRHALMTQTASIPILGGEPWRLRLWLDSGLLTRARLEDIIANTTDRPARVAS